MNEDSERIIAQLRTLKPALQKDMGIKRLRVFGSVARGDAGPDSDVDLIADMSDKADLITFYTVKNRIEDETGRKVDILTPDSIHRALKDIILSEARDV
jgi:hypothetical protein